MNLTTVRLVLSTFELQDEQCKDWGLVRSSCNSIGGRTSGNVDAQQLLELNPPTSSDIFQLRCAPTEDCEEESEAAEGSELESGEFACVQSVMRGRVYWAQQLEGVIIIREVPISRIPAYAAW